MAWNSDNPYSNYGQYGGGGMMQPPLWNSFPMNGGLPANKFGGGSPVSKFGGGSPVSGAPPGFTHPGGNASMMLEEFYNPTTGETYTAPHGGMSPGPGWVSSSGGMGSGGMGMPPMGSGGMGMPSMGMGATYWDEAGNQHQVGGQPGFWSPNLLPYSPPMESTPTPVPADPSVPPQVHGDPNWIGPDSEEAQKYHDRVKQMSEDFYRNNPEHFLSKIDSKVRQAFGMPQLGNTLNMGQGITPQTNWAGQGVTPQPEPSPQTQPQHQTQPDEYMNAAAFRHGSFPVYGPQKTGMEYKWGGALTPRTPQTTRPTWQENQAFEEAAKMRGRKARERAARTKQANARRAAQRRGMRSAEGAGRDTAGERSGGMGGGAGGFAGPDRW